MEKTGINKKPRKYDESFNIELLKMLKSGRSVAEVSRTMGIGENQLYKWRSEENGQEKPVKLEINTGIEHLRKQLKQAEIERDVLKKSDRRSGLSYIRSGNETETYENQTNNIMSFSCPPQF